MLSPLSPYTGGEREKEMLHTYINPHIFVFLFPLPAIVVVQSIDVEYEYDMIRKNPHEPRRYVCFHSSHHQRLLLLLRYLPWYSADIEDEEAGGSIDWPSERERGGRTRKMDKMTTRAAEGVMKAMDGGEKMDVRMSEKAFGDTLGAALAALGAGETGASLPARFALNLGSIAMPLRVEDVAAKLFAPNSGFLARFHRLQCHGHVREEAWQVASALNEGENEGDDTALKQFKRSVSYSCPATAFVKEFTCYETQWLAALAPGLIAFRVSSRTPEVPAGTCFTTELLYTIRSNDQPLIPQPFAGGGAGGGGKGGEKPRGRATLDICAEFVFHKGHVLRAAVLRSAPGPMRQQFDIFFAELSAPDTAAVSDADDADEGKANAADAAGLHGGFEALRAIRDAVVGNGRPRPRTWTWRRIKHGVPKKLRRLARGGGGRDRRDRYVIYEDVAKALLQAQLELDSGDSAAAIAILKSAPRIREDYANMDREAIYERERRVEENAKLRVRGAYANSWAPPGAQLQGKVKTVLADLSGASRVRKAPVAEDEKDASPSGNANGDHVIAHDFDHAGSIVKDVLTVLAEKERAAKTTTASTSASGGALDCVQEVEEQVDDDEDDDDDDDLDGEKEEEEDGNFTWTARFPISPLVVVH